MRYFNLFDDSRDEATIRFATFLTYLSFIKGYHLLTIKNTKAPLNYNPLINYEHFPEHTLSRGNSLYNKNFVYNKMIEKYDEKIECFDILLQNAVFIKNDGIKYVYSFPENKNVSTNTNDYIQFTIINTLINRRFDTAEHITIYRTKIE